MLEKTRILWKSLSRPNAEDENRKRNLHFIPSITDTRLGDGKILILQIKEMFRDYISMSTLLDTCWLTLEDMCDAYDNELIFK